jgi:hypothetical protein
VRLLRIGLALVFGIAMALPPDAGACGHHQPVHPHHQDTHGSATPAQACCPAAITVSLHTPSSRWTVGPAPVFVADVAQFAPFVLPPRTRVLPFAQAPPLPVE